MKLAKLAWIVIIIGGILLTTLSALAYETNQFNNAETTEFLSLSNDSSITRYVELPSSVNVTYASINNFVYTNDSLFLENFTTSKGEIFYDMANNGTNLFLAMFGYNIVDVASLDGTIISNISVKDYTYGVAYSDPYLFVNTYNAGTTKYNITAYNLSGDEEFTFEIQDLDFPGKITADNESVYVSDVDEVYVYNYEGILQGSYSLSHIIFGIAYSDNKVFGFDGDDLYEYNSTFGTINTFDYSTAICSSPGGARGITIINSSYIYQGVSQVMGACFNGQINKLEYVYEKANVSFNVSNQSINFDNEVITDSFASTINTFLDNGSCADGAGGTSCLVPFIWYPGEDSFLLYSNLNVSYDDITTPTLNNYSLPSSVRNPEVVTFTVNASDEFAGLQASSCTLELYKSDIAVPRFNITTDTKSGDLYTRTLTTADLGTGTLQWDKVWCTDLGGNTASNTSLGFNLTILAPLVEGGGGGGGGSSVTVVIGNSNLTIRPFIDTFFLFFSSNNEEKEWVYVLDVFRSDVSSCQADGGFSCDVNTDGTITFTRTFKNPNYVVKTVNATGSIMVGVDRVNFPVQVRAINLGYPVLGVLPLLYLAFLLVAIGGVFAWKSH